jgi:hypothetical protein
MNKLNCGVGDLAITVNSQLPENCGNIVRIISAIGFEKWCEYDELLYTWNVEVATEEGLLHYQYGQKMKAKKAGPVPDRFLRRLTPPKGYLTEEFADAEPVQKDLHLIDL